MGDDAYIRGSLRFLLQQWNKSIELISPRTRTENWFLLQSTFMPLGICGVYLALVFHFHFYADTLHKVGDGKGSKVKGGLGKAWILTCLQFYNILNVLINFVIAFGLTWVIVNEKYDFACQEIRDDDILASLFVYFFHISKVIELGDTAFIIARGKKRQLTFLHVYHHTTILCATWIGARVVPGGTTVIISMMNCWIHVIMYVYYNSKTTTTPATHKDVIFKKLLTIVQILQFVTTIGICWMTLRAPCGWAPAWVPISLILYMLTFVLLFVHFYVATYI